MTDKLASGDTFPQLTLNIEDGSTLSLPEDLQATYNIVLFYRGHW